jgi:hypothetical protein
VRLRDCEMNLEVLDAPTHATDAVARCNSFDRSTLYGTLLAKEHGAQCSPAPPHTGDTPGACTSQSRTVCAC